MIIQIVEEGFTSDDYDTSGLDKGEDDVIQDEKKTITLTTTDNHSNNNVTLIDLGEYETLLRKQYNIPDNENLYIVRNC